VIHLRGKILVQRPTERDVEDLHPPADAEDRHLSSQRVLQQGHLERVTFRERDAELGNGFLTVVTGIQVAATAEQ
jgi:hypothetical protein